MFDSASTNKGWLETGLRIWKSTLVSLSLFDAFPWGQGLEAKHLQI